MILVQHLVERLRNRAAWINFPHHGEEHPTEDAKLMTDAADALEILLKRADEWETIAYGWQKACKGLQARMPRWTPVAERDKLPQSGSYLVAFKPTKDAPYIVSISEIAWWKDRSGASDPFYQSGVTHWMPKPNPPEDGGQEDG